MTLIDTMHKPCDSKMNEMFNKKIKNIYSFVCKKYFKKRKRSV